ncbi:MAG: DUF6364 family protein [Salinivirgaceae bacterium]|jgi:hypothetical protein|nr:DUF6364 family protein [Salinivirgaceae bacterium]
MNKITLSFHDSFIKEKIKEYAKERGLTVSAIVENYLKSLIKLTTSNDKQKAENIPAKLDDLLKGIEIGEQYKNMDYKELRDQMYVSRSR